MKYLTRFNKLSDYIGNIDNLEYPSTSYIDEDETVRYGLPSELTDKVKAIWIPYGKSNEDEDRDIIYDLSGNGNNLELTGFQWTKDSGYSDYSVDFTKWTAKYGFSTRTKNKFTITNGEALTDAGYFLWDRNAKSGFKVKITNIPNNGWMSYRYRVEDNEELQSLFIRNDGIYQLPSTLAGDDVSFFISQVSAPANDWVGLTIEQIPNNEHALITSGSSDELISSKDPISKITGNSNTITVLSVVENLDSKTIDVNFIGGDLYGNNIRNNILTDSGICVAGYSGTSEDENPTLINTILGDKNKIKFIDKYRLTENNKILINKGAGGVGDYKLSWYGTIIAVGELSEYEMCTLLGYYILDRLIKPDVYYNIEKQGITNGNHSKFNDKLIDFSGYGRDLTLSNFNWNGSSGVGRYNYTYIDKVKTFTELPTNYISLITPSNVPVNGDFKFKISGTYDNRIGVEIAEYTSEGLAYYTTYCSNGIHLHKMRDDTDTVWIRMNNALINGYIGSITVEFLPNEYSDALIFDGVDDYGKVTGMPIYKDYTVVADYERFYLEPITGGRASILSKSSKIGDGAFIFNLEDQDGGKACYTFGKANGNIPDDITRSIRYQTKYYNTRILDAGTGEDNDFMILGKVREVDSRHFYGAIYSFMTFPYSMSEFLLNRKLKKLGLESLNLNNIVWYPIVNTPIRVDNITQVHIKGNEITNVESSKSYNYEDATLKLIIDTYDDTSITSVKVNGVECQFEVAGTYTTPFPTTSPQLIEISIKSDNFVLDASNRWDSSGIWKSTGIFRF